MSNQSNDIPPSFTSNVTAATLFSQDVLDTIPNDSIPQEYLNVAKQMMLSKSMYTIVSLGFPAYAHLDRERIKMEQEIVDLKVKETADQEKILQLESDKVTLKQRIQELEATNKTAIAENEKLAMKLEVCEEKLEDATSCIQDLETIVKEQNTEIAQFKSMIGALEINNEKNKEGAVSKRQAETDGQSSKRGKYDAQ